MSRGCLRGGRVGYGGIVWFSASRRVYTGWREVNGARGQEGKARGQEGKARGQERGATWRDGVSIEEDTVPPNDRPSNSHQDRQSAPRLITHHSPLRFALPPAHPHTHITRLDSHTLPL